MPTFVPVDMPLYVELLGELVGVVVFNGVDVNVCEATAVVAEGVAVIDTEPVVAEPNNCKTWISVDCHRI